MKNLIKAPISRTIVSWPRKKPWVNVKLEDMMEGSVARSSFGSAQRQHEGQHRSRVHLCVCTGGSSSIVCTRFAATASLLRGQHLYNLNIDSSSKFTEY